MQLLAEIAESLNVPIYVFFNSSASAESGPSEIEDAEILNLFRRMKN